MSELFSENGIQPGNPEILNGSFLRKFAFMTIVVFAVYSILSVVGFFLWFAFPFEKIHGLTYLRRNDLILSVF